MKLQYNGRLEVGAGTDTVWAFVTDPEKVGRCLPDLDQLTVQDPRHFEAIVRVGVGPVRGKFKMKLELQPDAGARHIVIKSSGGGFGSTVDLVAGADLVPVDDTKTMLDWNGEAEMRGPVAAVGGRVLDAQAKKLIEQTFANVREKLSPSPQPQP